MKFKNFKTENEKEINEFLKDNSKFISQGGVIKGVGEVGFLYADESEEEYAKNFRKSAVESAILKLRADMDNARVDEIFYRRRMESSDKDQQKLYGDLLINATNSQKEITQKIEACQKLIEEI